MAADVTAIAAVAENGAIGFEGAMPWDDYPADLKRFRDHTEGHPVILGRVTYESIVDRLGGPLPERTNVVVSESKHFSGEWVRTVQSPGSAISLSLRIADECYIGGGESIYKSLLPVTNRLLVTRIPESPRADSFFPDLGDSWDLVDSEDGPNGLVFEEFRKQSKFD